MTFLFPYVEEKKEGVISLVQDGTEYYIKTVFDGITHLIPYEQDFDGKNLSNSIATTDFIV